MPKGNCEFRGTGGQYFVTVFIHLFLISILSFGIYSAWAWVRLLRLKASHTVICGKQVSFTGTGGQLFGLVLLFGLLTLVTFGIYGPWAMCRLFNWRARNTLVEGKPSQFVGTGGSLFLFCLIHLMLLPMLTFGIYSFYGAYRLHAWKEEHTRYGGEKTSFGAGFVGFLKVLLITWILNTVTLCLISPWTMCMSYRWETDGLAVGDAEHIKHFPAVRTSPLTVIIIIIIGLILIMSLGLYIKNQFKAHYAMVDRFTQDMKQSHVLTLPVKKPAIPVVSEAVKKTVRTEPTQQEVAVSTPQPPGKKPEQKTPDYSQDIKGLDALLKKDPGNADALYNRAWYYALKGDLEQAVRDYTQAIKINDSCGDAYYNRGILYVRMKKWPLAVNDFDRAIKLDPVAVDAYCNRGNANYQLGKDSLAIRDYTTALKLKPGDADLYYNRGIAFLSGGQESSAAEDFKKAAGLGQQKAKRYLKSAQK
ncbi:MAG: DUF898 family protein [Thermodesulfobacteriota bacterium]|nr:DUF898 family protein [Thermodesulfobacteriota bacterium]